MSLHGASQRKNNLFWLRWAGKKQRHLLQSRSPSTWLICLSSGFCRTATRPSSEPRKCCSWDKEQPVSTSLEPEGQMIHIHDAILAVTLLPSWASPLPVQVPGAEHALGASTASLLSNTSGLQMNRGFQFIPRAFRKGLLKSAAAK